MAADTWGAGGSIVASRIPSGFNWQVYIDANPDLKNAGIDTENEALRHYSMFGYAEGRPGATPAANADTWAKNVSINESRIPSGFNWRDYLGANPDLNSVGIDTEGEARRHYAIHGYAENRPGVPKTTATVTTTEQGPSQKQIDDFRAAMLRKDFAGAANIAKTAGVSSEDVANFINADPASFGLSGKVSAKDVDTFFTPSTTTTTTPTTQPVTTVTDYRGRTYDRNDILNVARQIVPYIGTLKGGIYGTKKQSVGFSFEEGTKILGQEPSPAEQVLFDMARNLVKRGITDLSKLSLKPTIENLPVRQFYDESGIFRNMVIIPTGDPENSITRYITPDEFKKAQYRTADYGEGIVQELVTPIQVGTGLYFGNQLIESVYGGPENIKISLGETYSGPGMTGYVLEFNPATGGPQFNTFGEDTGQGQLISTVLTFASFIPGAQPFVAIASAALAAERGDVLGALTALAGINGPSNVSTALQVANAIDKKNWANAIGALMNNPDLAPSIGGIKLEGNITIKDIANAVNIGIAIDKNDIAGALAAASALTKSTDLQTAATAIKIVKALESGNMLAIVNAVKDLDKTINAANNINDSKVIKDLVDASSDLGQVEPEVEDQIITAIKEAEAEVDQGTINVSAPVDEDVITMPDTGIGETIPSIDVAAADTGTKTDVVAPTTGQITETKPTTQEDVTTLPTVVVTPQGGYVEIEELFAPQNVYEAVKNIRQLFSYGTPGEVPEDAVYFALFGTGGTGTEDKFSMFAFETPQERQEALKIIKYVIDNPATPENERNLAQIAFDNIAEIPSTFEIENNIPVVVEAPVTPGGGGGGGGGMTAGEIFAPGGATQPTVTPGGGSSPNLDSLEAEIERLLLEEKRPVQAGDTGQISIRPGGTTSEVTPDQDIGGSITQDVADVTGGADTTGEGETISEGIGEGAGPGTETGVGTGEGAGTGEGIGGGQGPGVGEGEGGGLGEGGTEPETDIENEIIRIIEDSINVPTTTTPQPDRVTSTLSPRITGEALASILGEKEPLFGGDEDEQRAVWNRRSLRLRRALGL